MQLLHWSLAASALPFVAYAVMLISPTSAFAQRKVTTIVDAASLCGTCITLDTAFSIDLPRHVPIRGVPTLAALPDSTYLIAGLADGYVLRHDPRTGELTHFGQSNDNQRPAHVAVIDSSVAVWSPTTGLLIYDLNGVQLSTAALPLAVFGMLAGPPGTLLVHGVANTPTQIGYPLHLVTLQGEILKSFGDDTIAVAPSSPYAMRRAVTGARRGLLWSLWRGSYRFAEYAYDGSLMREYTRVAPWFDSYTSFQHGEPHATPPRPFSVGVLEFNDSTILVAVLRRDRQWAASDIYDPLRLNAIYDTTLELIDPHSDRVFAIANIDEAMVGVVDSALLYSLGEGRSGGARITVMRVVVTNSQRRPR